jgi:AcrR family transcriptional regulator
MAQETPSGRRAQELSRERMILRAALEELALSDYGGMTMEAVAARAGVNKTTLYRKWETKAELIRAALEQVFKLFPIRPTAGDLRTDLLRIAHQVLDFSQSSEGQSLMRLRLLQQPEPELAEIAKGLHSTQLKKLSALFKAAIARRELGPDVDMPVLLDMLWGAVHARVMMRGEAVDAATLEHMVDLLLKAASPTKRLVKAKR